MDDIDDTSSIKPNTDGVNIRKQLWVTVRIWLTQSDVRQNYINRDRRITISSRIQPYY